MGRFGNGGSHTVKTADKSARAQDTRPTMHGTRGEWNLMSGTGAAIDWGLERDGDVHVQVTGEGPGRQR